ncbi:RagB/SusD family nutrient uptake outer membrane protein [Christiangramia fulva]|uniref:RagB/SusD family nutrient uptake outer membrane protein n=1 Tax=Christiangramia fulva TaxID=2126553 RepID=A0A2R3ZB49_9FLAO|nr:RagB/SusD family nutrient uptake outer membrane protein [Christiangramia fulva]AVR47513.1 RagB/SusD family nutrient uptake outer membrane protein [Christiangramia fulva]
MKNNKIKIFIVGGALAFNVFACTDLEIDETDSLIVNQTGEFTGVADVEATLAGIYDALRGQIENQANLYALNEVSSDELVVPTRGTDWGDNGVWRTLHQHSWSAIHPYVRDTWNEQNSNVFRTTEVIDSRSNPSAQQEAEARFLRAFSMFWIMDLYGQVPFREPDEGIDVDPRVFSRSEAFDFIVNDLTTALQSLPETGPGPQNDKATAAAAHFLLAKLYLNKHIYYGNESADPADMEKVVEHVDALQDLGFGLVDGYFEIFQPDLDNETIFYTHSSVGNRIWNTLHYNQNSPDNEGGGWNGFTTLAEFYDLFEGDPNTNFVGDGQEERRGWVPDATTANDQNYGIGYGFLIGQQYDTDGSKLKTRPGADLVFTKQLPGLLGNNERTGIRVIKYHPFDGTEAASFRGHEIVFRYSDAHLMKAEAIFRGASGDALALVNELRTLRKASPLSSLTEKDLIDERGRELYGEFWRRNDQVRFGTFTTPWAFKENTQDFRVLYPIPASAIISNPNLTQNPGY